MENKNLNSIIPILDKEDAKLVMGLTSIERGDFHLARPDLPGRFGARVVIDNEMNLRGLISNDNEEILPCIFDDVNVTLSAYIEVHFKGVYYEFSICPKGFKPREGEALDDTFFSSKEWYFEIGPYEKVFDMETAQIKMDETTQLLFSLLNVKHGSN